MRASLRALLDSARFTCGMPQALAARQETGLSQAQFAELLGVTIRTLQGWEQGRKQPSSEARTLLTIPRRNPKALRKSRKTLRAPG